jgi:GH24 family phage-related lysozyme (muramidase)
MSPIENFLSLFRQPPSPVVATVAAPLPVLSPLGIPDDALTFVEDEEDGSPGYYVKAEEHWSWPGGVSGPTLGVGYDCGYVINAEAEADWTGIVDPATVQRIIGAVGHRGAAAEAYVAAHRNEITITWDQAIAEFKAKEVPKWLARCRAALPNFDLLHSDCQGAVFSLSYNRGTGGYDDPGPRDLEMREIKAAMIAKNFSAIPPLILSMQRIWPRGGDLWKRRAHESALFEQGLKAAA